MGKIQIKGQEILSETASAVTLRFGAGEVWDDVVNYSVENGWSGIEALSAIPGTIGAAPVQNIGAYGSEIKDVLVSVEVYDRSAAQVRKLTKRDCLFDYRDSIFKHQPDRFIITHVVLKLKKSPPEIPRYQGVKEYLARNFNNKVSLSSIRNSIIAIRSHKLPDPSVVPNVGSFFKNPIISKEKLSLLLEKYPALPHYQTLTGVKIPAGWLIEQAGFKGKIFGGIKVFDQNALVLTNFEHASFANLDQAVRQITKSIKRQFNIDFETEPTIIRSS